MIDLYYYPTPNTWKVSIMLEECGLPYRVVPVNIGAGDQFKPEFLAISPNNRVPAIVDHDAEGGRLSIFESGAILVYLAEKTGRFMPKDLHGRMEVLQWLFWQMGGMGPMFGQVNHFKLIAPEKIEYAIRRYVNEANRLFGVMDRRLADREYLAGDYSIADMACYGWATYHEVMEQNLDEVPNVKRWFERMSARPAVQLGISVGASMVDKDLLKNEKARKILFGQTARSLDQGAPLE